MCDACNEQFAVETWGDGSPIPPTPRYCEVCDRDSSADSVIARWRDSDVCTDCLEAWYAMEAEDFWEEEDAR